MSVFAVIAIGLTSCQGAPTPTSEVDRSPLVSPVETATVAPTDTKAPTATKTEPPATSKCPEGCTEPSEGCLIKGVVTGMGDKYYYLPDTEGYEDALLLVKYGGRWFCTVEEAQQNGFEKPPE
jgi:hypothetical protein